MFAYCMYTAVIYLVSELSKGFTSKSGICTRLVRSLELWLKKVVTMAESLQKLVENLQAEINNLQAQVNTSRPTTPKDLSQISLIPKWSRTENSVSVKEFFESVESVATLGNWIETDKKQIMVLKLTEVAKAFYSSNPELHGTSISWENFKAKFLHRFRDVRNDQYHFMQLQTAKQQKHETPREYLDRCR